MVSYLIKYIVCSGLLFAAYHFFLEREKMLRFNRFYLLAAMVFSTLIPFCTIEMPSEPVTEPANVGAVVANVSDFIPVNSPAHSEIAAITPFADYLPWLVYALVSITLLARLFIHIARIQRSKSGRELIPFETAQLVLVPGNAASYTFFKSIFISKEAFEEARIPKEILTHELAHAKQMHSLDITFAELMLALCWFNPLLLLYGRAIRLNHEFLADEAVLTGSTDVGKYQLLLLDTLLARPTATLSSSFNYPVTKKRLAMMTTNINLRIQFLKKTFIALLLPLMAFVFVEKTYSQDPAEKPATTSRNNTAASSENNSGTVSKTEMSAFFAQIEKHTKYVTNKKGRTDPIVTMPAETENELYAVYERMNDTQKQEVSAKEIRMFRMAIPVKKAPTPEIFENWKRPEVFGIWLNGKHVPNSALNNYTYTDIAEYDLSKLYGAALKGRIYKYQLELLTNDHFDKTYDERVKNRVLIIRPGWLTTTEAPKKSKK